MQPLIAKWSDPPTPSEILEVLDHCIHGALASGFMISVLQRIYKEACDAAGMTHDEVARGAVWRNREEKEKRPCASGTGR